MARPGSRFLPPDRSASRPELIDLVGGSELDSLVAPWRALAARVPDTSYFQTPDWVLSWWVTVGERAPTRVAYWRDERGELAAVVALSRARERLHRRIALSVPVYTNAGSGPGDADHCGPLVLPELWPDVNDWLAEAIGSHSLLVRNAPSGLPLFSDARVVEATSCPRLDLRAAERNIGRSSNFRRQLRRYSNRLRESGVTFEWVPAGEVGPPVIDSLLRLHSGRRASAGRETSLTARHRDLLLLLGETARPVGGPSAIVARDGADVVGVCYGFEWNGCFSAYQSGWDPAYADRSLGTVLVYEALLGARAAGLHTFDFLRGAEAYKFRFGAGEHLDVTYLVGNGVTGRLLGARARLRARSGRARSSAQTEFH
jgi:CelD/BcsL family acetyltransferase involved in cellulose biosynthesis